MCVRPGTQSGLPLLCCTTDLAPCAILACVTGYEANVFGVRHECKVKIPGDPIVRVVAPLPEICLRLFPALPASEECPLSPSLRVSKAYIPELELLDGETYVGSHYYTHQAACAIAVGYSDFTPHVCSTKCMYIGLGMRH